jgi:hypothetical protein
VGEREGGRGREKERSSFYSGGTVAETELEKKKMTEIRSSKKSEVRDFTTVQLQTKNKLRALSPRVTAAYRGI